MPTTNQLHEFPKSSTRASTVLIGLISIAICTWLLIDLPLFDLSRQAAANADAAAFLVIWGAVPMVMWEVFWLKSYQNPSANLAQVRQVKSLRRVALKWLGLAFTFAVMAFLYWLLPLYKQDFYKPFMESAASLLSTILLLAWPYFSWVDKRQDAPEQDAYFKIGLGVISFFRSAIAFYKAPKINDSVQGLHSGETVNSNSSSASNPKALSDTQEPLRALPAWLSEHIRAWGVKLFFLPLMFGFICENLAAVSGWHFKWQDLNWVQLVEHLSFCIFMLDLLWGCAGYLWSLKVCDSHIRSTEPTLLGWAVALAFYAPFNQVLGPSFFAYETNMKWHHWLAAYPQWAYVWGSLLLLLNLCFVWATVVFGLRFSNLTNRGIITSGPYRYFKHPAYICKNLSWWMVAMPFMVIGTYSEALRLSLILLLANLGYYLRAKTEERHLLKTCPDYALYCRALAQSRHQAWTWRIFAKNASKPS